jgi:hypothetical protein
MKIKQTLAIAFAGLLIISLAGSVWAQQAGNSEETRNLFETTDKKQTNKDFKPAPDESKTSFGNLNFELEAFPTEESVKLIYDEMDRQRATQAYMDFYPTLSVNAILKAQIRDFGFKTASDAGVMPGPGLTPSELYLTGNNSTVYACASLDLKVDGPTVVEIPAGMYGTADDAAFIFLTDIGFVGPDKGKGGKYLFVPPGYTKQIPDGYFVIKSHSYRVWVMMRGWGDIGSGEKDIRY